MRISIMGEREEEKGMEEKIWMMIRLILLLCISC
jgi:hypothetical protein